LTTYQEPVPAEASQPPAPAEAVAPERLITVVLTQRQLERVLQSTFREIMVADLARLGRVLPALADVLMEEDRSPGP
jgi:hypothetical protein